jgi:hypothetical protein
MIERTAMRLKPLNISMLEYEQLHGLQKKPHKRGWWAVFSVNRHEMVWPFVCYGYTPEDKREYVRLADYTLLRNIAQDFLSNVDEDGGRFFVDKHGVFGIKGEDEKRGVPQQFLEWRPDEPLPERLPGPPPPSAEEMRAEYQEMLKNLKH